MRAAICKQKAAAMDSANKTGDGSNAEKPKKDDRKAVPTQDFERSVRYMDS